MSKTRLRNRTIVIALALLVGLVMAMSAGGTAAATGDGPDVDPMFVNGNPTCADLGYDFGYKPQPEPPPTGTYTFPDGINTVDITSDGTYFDWMSTLGIDAVIVKGGPNANVYVYDPESFGDDGLSSPINPNTHRPYDISHIDFCYDYEVDVTKDAHTTFTRTYEWTIDKSVTPDMWQLFTGDSGTSKYTVSVVETFTDSDWAVNGTIRIENNTPFAASITGVSDVVSPDIDAVVDCGYSVTFPYELPAGEWLECTYATPLPDGSTRTNTATVYTDPYGIVGGGEATADVVFGDPTTVIGYEEIHVEDTNGESLVFTGTASATYGKTFTCDDEGENPNTATIVETGQSASASVGVECYELTVEKDAKTSLDRTWMWTIDKYADESYLVLSPGQVHDVHYSVMVDAVSVDSNWAVSGEIFVENDTPLDALINGVDDMLSGYGDVSVYCGVAFPYVLPAGETLACDYGPVSLPDGATRTNTATATLQNYDYAPDGAATIDGTTDFSRSAIVDFANAMVHEIDECIDVSDTFAAFLGTVCADDTLPATFTYTRTVGPYYACGEYTVENTASFVTNDTGTMGSDSWIIYVEVPCDGCTLTQGYWKTHSEYGPAPYDDTWALLPDGADTHFFGTGYSYYEILNMPPQGGNAYLILAHQYIAAELNVLNGAYIPPEVLDAWLEAQALLVQYEDEVDIPKNKKADRARAIYLAGILDDYNNGYLGPGHCSE